MAEAYGIYTVSASSSTGDSGASSVSNSGAITTSGAGASGISAYSDGYLILTNTGNLTITGYGAEGISAWAWGSMTVVNSGSISTTGDDALGIAAGSIGDLSLTNTGNITTIGYGASGIGANSNGGLSFTNSGNVSTAGDYAQGIFADSIGDLSLTNSGNITTIGYGASGIGADSNGGLSFTNSGNVSTAGDYARGIYALSTGGLSLTNSGSLSTAGDYAQGIYAFGAASLSLTNSGTVTTAGAYSDGILAAAGSLTGTGTGAPFSVSITAGSIVASGPNASGINALSVDPTVNMAISVASSASVIGGTETGAGVHFGGGGVNTLTNHGTIASSSGLSGYAVLGDTNGTPPTASTLFSYSALPVGNNTVDNYGLIAGNVDLGAGVNAFNNQAGGVFYMGPAVSVGAGNTLTNSGVLMAGVTGGTIQTTALTGNLVQTSTGQLLVDANWATGQASRINVSGTAVLAGSVLVNPINFTALNEQFTILQAAGGVTNNGIAVANASTAAVSYKLLFPDANDMVLGVAINFLGNGTVSGNQSAVGQTVNAIVGAGGSSSFNPVSQALMTLPNQQSLAAALNQLSPDAYAKAATGLVSSNYGFSNSLLSCRVPDGGFAFIAEGQCVWAQVRDRTVTRFATSDSIGEQEHTAETSGGIQVAIAKDWFGGIGMGYERSSLTTDTLASGTADRFESGAVVKYNPGALLLAAELTGGASANNTIRPIDFGGFTGMARSANTIGYLGSQLRAAYLIDLGGWYLKPVADANALHLDIGGFSETGAGGAGFTSPGAQDTVLSVSPSLEIGAQYAFADGTLIRPFLRGGVTWFDRSDLSIGASFEGAPAGTAPFSVSNSMDRVLGDVSVGMDVLANRGLVIKLNYDGHFGETTRDQSFGGKVSLRF